MKAKLVQLAGTASLLVLTSFTAHAKLSAKSYISNGLIGHWDGIENVAYGQAHDPDATRWYDLSGQIGGYFKANEVGSFVDGDGLQAAVDKGGGYSKNAPQVYLDAFSSNATYSVEIAYDLPEKGAKVIFLGLATSRYFVCLTYGSGTQNAGFSGNGFRGTTAGPAFTVNAGSVVGQHTFSCIQNGSEAAIDFDGLATATKTDIATSSTIDMRFALKLGMDYNTDSIAGLGGKYHAIRFYNRALSPNEVAVNRAVDQIRFFGKTADEVVLPDGCGYRFVTAGDEVFLEKRAGTVIADDAAGGTFSLNGEPAATSAELWVDTATGLNALSLVATPAAGYAFIRWEGGDMPDADRKNLSVSISVGQTDNIVARFRKIGRTLAAKDYVTEGLIGHWDGVENVSYGSAHDGAADEWKELTGKIGGSFRTGNAGWSFSDTGLVSQPGTVYCIYSRQPPSASYTEAFNGANFTVEIAYTAPAEQSRIKFLGLGYANYYVGYDDSSTSGLGFSGPGFAGNRLRPNFTVHPQGISGTHTFSCRQNGSRADIDYDGTLTGVKEGIVPVSNIDTRWALQLGCDYDSIVASQNNVFPLDGTYHAIRFYSRALTPDEVMLNRAVDQVRYCGIDPLDVTLPDGWRFNTAEGIALEQKFAVTSSDATMGLVSVGDGEPAASADCWVEKAVPTMVKLTATPAKDYKFVRWEGAIAGDNLKAATGTFAVSGNVTAVFKKVSGLLLLFR